MPPHVQAVMIMVALMAFVIWRRARRLIGRQLIRRKAMITRIVIYLILTAMLSLSGLRRMHLLTGLAGGILVGALLGLIGLRLSRFERGEDGRDYYVPNPWIGGVLILILIGRIAWRLSTMPMGLGSDPTPTLAVSASHAPPLGDSPLTLLTFGLLVGYYLAYYIGLMIHHRRFVRCQPPFVRPMI